MTWHASTEIMEMVRSLCSLSAQSMPSRTQQSLCCCVGYRQARLSVVAVSASRTPTKLVLDHSLCSQNGTSPRPISVSCTAWMAQTEGDTFSFRWWLAESRVAGYLWLDSTCTGSYLPNLSRPSGRVAAEQRMRSTIARYGCKLSPQRLPGGQCVRVNNQPQ